jgi:hypothetical protein
MATRSTKGIKFGKFLNVGDEPEPIVPTPSASPLHQFLDIEMDPLTFALGGRPFTNKFKKLFELSPLMHDPNTPWGGYVYGDRPEVFLSSPFIGASGAPSRDNVETVAHEVGHRASDFTYGYTDLMGEFAVDVNNYLKDRPGYQVGAEQPWDDLVRRTLDHPGVAGNPMDQIHDADGNFLGEWGGPGELWARWFEWSNGSIDSIPPSMRKYFSDWLGPANNVSRDLHNPVVQTSYLHRENAKRNNAAWSMAMHDLITNMFPDKKIVQMLEDGSVQFDDGNWVKVPEHVQNGLTKAARSQIDG